MRIRRVRDSVDPPRRGDGEPADGLSRRGWALLIAATGAAAVVLLVVAAFSVSIPAVQALQGQAPPAPEAPGPAAGTPDPQAYARRPSPTRTPATTPVATVPAQPVGTLKTGDCLQTYPSQWEAAYPVIDCAAPHIAQVLSTGTLPQAGGAPFPGVTALNEQATDLCSAPDLLNWDWVAVWNEDTQIDARYPNTEAQWESGERTYYCFVYTWSRHELTGSAVPSR